MEMPLPEQPQVLTASIGKTKGSSTGSGVGVGVVSGSSVLYGSVSLLGSVSSFGAAAEEQPHRSTSRINNNLRIGIF